MQKVKRSIVFLFVAWFAFSGVILTPNSAEAAPNDYVTVTKSVNPAAITTLDETEVTLNITGTPPVNVVMPNDVVLIIDKSGSMAPTYPSNNGEDKMKNAKEAAKGFVDLMNLNIHRVAVVDYSAENMIGQLDFTTDAASAKNYIDTIQAAGATATGNAIDAARLLLENHRPEAQPVIVIMTDGEATVPNNDPYGYATEKARLAKEEGIIFYTIALLNPNENPETSGPNILLKEMATTASHHHFVLGSTGLSEIYAAIVKEIGMASAYDVSVTDIVSEHFEIVPGSYDQNIPKPVVNGNTLSWTFNELKNSTLTFKYKIRPVSSEKTGKFPVSLNTSMITYKDYAGASRTKSIPIVNVDVKLPTPVITSVVESAGHPNGGETVTINGEYFVNGAKVYFGSSLATNTVFVSSKELTVTAPSGSQGTVAVKVTNPDGQFATASYQYKADPIVTYFSPTNGPLAGGNTVVIRGDYLMKGVKITFGENAATVKTQTGVTYLTLAVPAATEPGAVDVTFTNPDGTSLTMEGAYTYNAPPSTAPELVTISPTSGLVTGGNTIYFNGVRFTSDLKAFVGEKEAVTKFDSVTRLIVTAPAADEPGTVNVSLRDGNGNIYELKDAYTYNAITYPAPVLTSISPASGLISGGNSGFINGKNFVRDQTKVYIGSNEATITSFTTTRLTIKIPAGDAAGKVNVRVVTDVHSAELTEAYEYTLPVIPPVSITSVSPNKGLTSGGNVVYINGVNFDKNAVISFGENEVTGTSTSSTRISVVVPAAASVGKVDITVTNPDGGSATLVEGYEYTIVTPTITSISPGNANRVGGATIYVNGTNFEKDSIVSINGVDAATTFSSKTRLVVIVPASDVIGEVPLVVTLPNGETATATFIYDNGPALPSPKINTLSLTSGKAGVTVYVNGANFNKQSVVYVNDTPVATTYSSTSRLIIKMPSGFSGPVDVKVVNENGQESNVIVFTYI